MGILVDRLEAVSRYEKRAKAGDSDFFRALEAIHV